MAHIDLKVNEQNFPGITGLLMFRPETAKPLKELADVLLRSPQGLSPGERELIAAYVSALNQSRYCHRAHSATAAAQLDGGASAVEQAITDLDNAPVSPKLRALLHIAGAVRTSGSAVSSELIATARQAGATDVELHDTVLLAAVFCMFNRYVDGLDTYTPEDEEGYAESARWIVDLGYAGSLAALAYEHFR